MPQIEHRAELDANLTHPDCSGIVLSEEEIAAGAHRAYVGGVWDSHSQRQQDFLISQGLKPHHRLIDIGCGAFRAAGTSSTTSNRGTTTASTPTTRSCRPGTTPS